MPPIDRTKSTYQFDQVLLESERLPKAIELKNVVTDIDIYEHLDKPYLSAEMVVVDQTNMYETAGLIGGEKITITITSSKLDVSVPITKTFYVADIRVKYVNDDSQIIIFELIEDIAFISNLFNVNRFYSGKCSKIIEKIAKQYFGKEVDQLNKDLQNIHLIVPNMDPINAMTWIRNRATTTEGYPFYLHSVFANDKLYLRDLGTIFSDPVINPYRKFKNDVASADSMDNYMIIRHKFHSYENMFMMIAKGLVGSQYQYIDTTQENTRKFSFDVRKDVYDTLINKGVMQGQDNPDFSELYKVNAKSFNKFKSRNITMVGGSNAQRDFFKDANGNDTWNNSYSESKTSAGYKQQIIARAMDNIMKRSSLEMIVSGLDFLDGDKHSTVGNNIAVEFTKSSADRNRASSQVDTRRSGNYTILAARHMFKKERYDIALSCVKLGNLRSND
jgi:hypothetical protein